MSDKKLTISVDSKVSPSVQQLGRMLDDLSARGNKVAKSFQGISGSGSGGQVARQGGIAKALLQEKKLFDDLGKSGERLSKILNEQVAKSQGSLARQLDASTKKLESMVQVHERAQRRLERLKTVGSDPARIALAERYATRSGSGVQGAAVDVLNLQQQMEAAKGGASGGGASSRLASSIFSQAMGQAGNVPGMSFLMGGGKVLGGIGAFIGGVAAGAKMAISAMNQDLAAAGSVGQVGSRMMSTGLAGDAATLLGSGLMGPNPSGSGARETRDLAPRTLWNKLLIGAKVGGLGALGDLYSRSGRAHMSTNYDAQVKSWREGAELDRARELGGAFQTQADVMDAQLARASQIVGLGRRYGSGTYERLQRMGASMRVDPGDLTSYLGPLASYVGSRGALGYASRVGGAQRAGMDPNVALQIIGQTAVGGANVLSATAGMDPTIRGILGSAVGSTMDARGMMYGGAGGALAEAMTGGVVAGGPAGIRQAQQAALGSQLYGQAFGGHDPYQKSYNIAAASAALGSGASPYTRNFLATQMSDPKVLASVMAGQLPNQFRYMGVSLEQAQRTARDIDRGLVAGRWFDVGGDTPSARRMRDIRAAGGPIAWARAMRGASVADREQALEEAAPLLAQVQMGLTGGDVGAGESLLRGAMGLGLRGAGGHSGRGRGGKGAARPEDSLADRWGETMQFAADTVGDLSFKMKEAAGAVINMTDASKKFVDGIRVQRERLGIPVFTSRPRK